MKKYALGAALAAAGMVTQALPASADKLDDVLARLQAIEQNNSKLAKENADLKSRLNKVEFIEIGGADCHVSPSDPRSGDGYGHSNSAAVIDGTRNRQKRARIS